MFTDNLNLPEYDTEAKTTRRSLLEIMDEVDRERGKSDSDDMNYQSQPKFIAEQKAKEETRLAEIAAILAKPELTENDWFRLIELHAAKLVGDIADPDTNPHFVLLVADPRAKQSELSANQIEFIELLKSVGFVKDVDFKTITRREVQNLRERGLVVFGDHIIGGKKCTCYELNHEI